MLDTYNNNIERYKKKDKDFQIFLGDKTSIRVILVYMKFWIKTLNI